MTVWRSSSSSKQPFIMMDQNKPGKCSCLDYLKENVNSGNLSYWSVLGRMKRDCW